MPVVPGHDEQDEYEADGEKHPSPEPDARPVGPSRGGRGRGKAGLIVHPVGWGFNSSPEPPLQVDNFRFHSVLLRAGKKRAKRAGSEDEDYDPTRARRESKRRYADKVRKQGKRGGRGGGRSEHLVDVDGEFFECCFCICWA